jgi:hypothetical protein
MNPLTYLRAKRDAAAQVDTVEEFLTSRHGVPLAWDPVENMEHAQVNHDLQGVEIEEYQERLRRVEDEQTHHESATSLTLKLAGCFIAEVLGCTLLFRGLGFNGIERFVPAILFAAFLFWITSETKRQGGAS